MILKDSFYTEENNFRIKYRKSPLSNEKKTIIWTMTRIKILRRRSVRK